GRSWVGAAFAVPALALIGALAVACFVKVYGIVFLGSSRSEHGAHAHESGTTMLGPMFLLAGCCFFIGLFPMAVFGLLEGAIRAWSPVLASQRNANLFDLARPEWLTVLGLALVMAIGMVTILFQRMLRSSPCEKSVTWDCGYAAPTPRMQYTASSFGQMIVG